MAALAAPARSQTALKLALLAAFAVGWHAAFVLPSPWLRMLVALALFTVPGLALQRLILGEQAGGFARQVTLGFTLSIGLTGLVGLAASLLRLPYAFVTEGLLVVGLVLAAWSWARSPLPRWRRPGAQAVADAALLLLVGLMAARLCLAPMLGADDFSHLARVRSFQQEPVLSFDDFVFGGHPAPPRYWLSFWPLTQAVVSTLSGLDVFEVLALYQAPLLAFLAVLATLALARALGLPEGLAMLAVPAQLVGLLLMAGRFQAGSIFFNRLAEDKVLAAFVIAPVVLRQLADALSRPSRRTHLALAAAGLALLFTHPTMLGMTCAIAAIQIAFDIAVTRRPSALVALGIMAALPVVPASFRFLEATSTVHDFTISEAADADRLDGPRAVRMSLTPGSELYAVSPELWAVPAFAVIPLGAAVSAFRLRRGMAPRYVLASSLVVASVTHPYTALVLGAVLTPFHLWRLLWLAPFGIGLAVVVEALADRPALRGLFAGRLLPWAAGALVIALPLATRGGRIGALESWPLPPGWDDYVYDTRRSLDEPPARFEDFRTLAQVLADRASERVAVLSDEPVNSFLPGLSARARPLFFRSMDQTILHGRLDPAKARQRQADWRSLLSTEEPPARRLALLDRDRVRYLLASREPAWVTSLLASFPERFREVARSGTLTLYEVLPAPPCPRASS